MLILQQIGSVIEPAARMPRNRLIMLTVLALLYLAVTIFNTYLHFAQGDQISFGDSRLNDSMKPTKKKFKVVKKETVQCNFAKTFNQQLQTEQNPNSKSYLVDSTNQKYYNFSVSQRAALGHARASTSKITFWVLNKRSKQKQANEHNSCYFSNGINIFTEKSIRSIKSLLQALDPFHKIIIALDDQDLKNIQLLRDQLGEYIRYYNSVQFDSDYKFITDIVQECHSFVYGFGNFIIDSGMANNIHEQSRKLSNLSLVHSLVYFQKKVKKSLQPLSQVSLESIYVIDFYKYMYIFDPQLLKIITPLNFAYYSKYTLEQMLLFPVLAILQESPNMKVSNKLMHGVDLVFQQQKQFTLQAPSSANNAFCFVSYPNDPFEPVHQDVSKYISAISAQQVKEVHVSVVLSAPYAYKKSKPLFEIMKELLQFKKNNSDYKVRFRVRANKTVSSLSVYEASYSYCPSKSIIISSRHNIESMSVKLLQKLKESVTQKYHYYFVNVINDQQQLTSLQQKLVFGKYRQTRKSSVFEQKLKHIQIFKSDLFKSNPFWMLKNEELDFYETQSSFVTLMMESIKLQMFIINETMVKIKTRNQTKLEKFQIENVKKFAQFEALPSLIPYRHNCLENIAFRRFAPEKIQRNIHQIWFGKDITPIRMKLHETVKNINKDFKVSLWTLQNITKEVAPYTYKLVHRTLEFHKQSQTSMYAMAADLLRYELVLRFGGFYIDFKFEALKPLNNFLKYEVMFIDYDIQSIRFGNPRAMGNGAFAAVKNNYHLNFLLTEIVNEYTVPMRRQINVITGGFTVRKTLNEEELFNWVNVGYHLIIPLPYESTANACGGFNKTFELDQEVVQVKDIHTDNVFKFGIPCREYPEAYLTQYEPLSKTWVRPKQIVN